MKPRLLVVLALSTMSLAACAGTSAPQTSVVDEPETIAPDAAHYEVPPVPEYPQPSLSKGEQGTALVRVRVNAAGQPESIVLERSSGHPALDRSALQAVRAARFKPYYSAGKAIPVQIVVPVRFVVQTRPLPPAGL